MRALPTTRYYPQRTRSYKAGGAVGWMDEPSLKPGIEFEKDSESRVQ